MVSVTLAVLAIQPVVNQTITGNDESNASTMGGHPLIWNLAMQDILMSPDPSSAGATTTITNRVINTAGGISYTSTIKGYIDTSLISTATIPDPLYPGQTWDHVYTATATSGYHDVKGEIVNGDNIQTDNIMIERHWWKGPDLVVDDLWAADLNGNQITIIAAGQQFTVNAKIRNAGDLTAPAGSIVDMEIAGAYGAMVSLSQALAPGASINICFWGNAGDYISYIKSPATYTITVTADYYNVIDEANTATGAGKGTAESNNVRSESFSVVKASWTVLIYSCADDTGSNLENAALRDYTDLSNGVGGSNKDVSIVMQLDRTPGVSTAYGDWTDTHRFIVKANRDPTVANSVESEEYDYLGEKDMSDPITLADFLTWGADRFRANNYFVILAGHGDGYEVCTDDSNPDGYGLWQPDLNYGFQAMTQEMASNGDGNKVDVVMLKACLAGTTEIAAEISPYADYLACVETVSENWRDIVTSDSTDLPYYTPSGTGIVQYLKGSPTTTPANFASQIVTMSVPVYSPSWDLLYGIDGESIASINLNVFESSVLANLDQFSLTLRNYIPAYKTEMINAIDDSKIMPKSDSQRDLYQYPEKIFSRFNGIVDPVVKQAVQLAAQNLMNAITSSVVNIKQAGYTGNCHGLSIYNSNLNTDPFGSLEYVGRLVDVTHWDEYRAALFETTGPSAVTVAVSPEDITYVPEIGVSYVGVEIATLLLTATDYGGIKEMYLTTHPPQWGSPLVFTSPYEFSLPAIDGQITIYFKVVNYAGYNTIATCTIFKDTFDPIADSIVIDGGAQYTLDKTVTLTLAAHDDGIGLRGMSFCLDGTSFPRPEPYATTYQYTMPSGQTDGLKTIYFRVVDWAWHIDTISSTIFLDENKPSNPTSSTSSPLTNTWTTDNTVDVTWSGAADGTGSGINGYSILWSTVSTDVPDTTVDTTSTSVTSAALADGLWYLHVRSQDKAGWWADGAYHIGPFKIDRTLPTNPTASTSSHTPGVPNTDTTIDITWSGATDALSGIQGYSFSWTQASGDIPDTTLDTTGTSTTSSVLAVGTWYFHVRTIDNAGNVATGAYHAGPFIIQAADSPPTAPGAPTWTAGDEKDGVFTLSWTAASDTDPTPVAKYELQESKDGGAWGVVSANILTTSYTVTYHAPGTYVFQVRAIDSGGLIGPWSASSASMVIPWQMRLTTNTAVSDYSAIAVDIYGNYHIVWMDARDGNNEIYYKKVDGNWNVLISDTRLSNNAQDSVSPAISLVSGATDKIVVVWSDNRNSGYYAIYSKTCTNGVWGAETQVAYTSGTNYKEPDVALDSSGGVNLVYRSTKLTTRQGKTTIAETILYKPPTGTKINTLYSMSDTYLTGASHDHLESARIVTGSSGALHVVFSVGPQYPVEGGLSYVYYTRKVSTSWEAVQNLATTTDAPRRCSIDADTGGRVYVVWDDWGSTGSFDVFFKTSANSGASGTWSIAKTFAGPTGSHQSSPEVTATSNGVVYIMWRDSRNTQYDIYYVKSVDYGYSFSVDTRLSSTTGNSYWPRAVVSSTGRVGVSWSDYTDGNWEIYFAAKML